MQFRKKALVKQQSPEELDVPVRLARPQGRLVLTVTAVAMAAAGCWAVTGTVSSKVSAPGMLIHPEGSYTLQSPVAGQIVAVLAKEGDLLPGGAQLFSVSTGPGQPAQVRTVAPGRVTTLSARIGTVVGTGSELATVERISGPDEPLVAVVYAPASSAASIPAGAAVDLTVQSVAAQQYGVLRGRVLTVGRAPETQQQIADFLGSGELGRRFTAQGRPVAVVVRLERSGSTRSGYVWSSKQGPPYPVESTTLVSAAVRLGAVHPVDWILP